MRPKAEPTRKSGSVEVELDTDLDVASDDFDDDSETLNRLADVVSEEQLSEGEFVRSYRDNDVLSSLNDGLNTAYEILSDLLSGQKFANVSPEQRVQMEKRMRDRIAQYHRQIEKIKDPNRLKHE